MAYGFRRYRGARRSYRKPRYSYRKKYFAKGPRRYTGRRRAQMLSPAFRKALYSVKQKMFKASCRRVQPFNVTPVPGQPELYRKAPKYGWVALVTRTATGQPFKRYVKSYNRRAISAHLRNPASMGVEANTPQMTAYIRNRAQADNLLRQQYIQMRQNFQAQRVGAVGGNPNVWVNPNLRQRVGPLNQAEAAAEAAAAQAAAEAAAQDAEMAQF